MAARPYRHIRSDLLDMLLGTEAMIEVTNQIAAMTLADACIKIGEVMLLKSVAGVGRHKEDTMLTDQMRLIGCWVRQSEWILARDRTMTLIALLEDERAEDQQPPAGATNQPPKENA
jgi:hypothetical protein